MLEDNQDYAQLDIMSR